MSASATAVDDYGIGDMNLLLGIPTTLCLEYRDEVIVDEMFAAARTFPVVVDIDSFRVCMGSTAPASRSKSGVKFVNAPPGRLDMRRVLDFFGVVSTGYPPKTNPVLLRDMAMSLGQYMDDLLHHLFYPPLHGHTLLADNGPTLALVTTYQKIVGPVVLAELTQIPEECRDAGKWKLQMHDLESVWTFEGGSRLILPDIYTERPR